MGYTLKLNQAGLYNRASVLPHILYNFGRITTYSLMGLLFGAIGETLSVNQSLRGFQGGLQFFAGVIMIWMALDLGGWIPSLSGNYFPGYRSFKKLTGSLLQRLNTKNIFLLGLVLGFIPCGLVYAAGAKAASSQGAFTGMLIMFVFGLGTLPALLTIGVGANYIGVKTRQLLFRAATVLVMILGIMTLYRGYYTLTDHALFYSGLHNFICHP